MPLIPEELRMARKPLPDIDDDPTTPSTSTSR